MAKVHAVQKILEEYESVGLEVEAVDVKIYQNDRSIEVRESHYHLRRKVESTGGARAEAPAGGGTVAEDILEEVAPPEKEEKPKKKKAKKEEKPKKKVTKKVEEVEDDPDDDLDDDLDDSLDDDDFDDPLEDDDLEEEEDDDEEDEERVVTRKDILDAFKVRWDHFDKKRKKQIKKIFESRGAKSASTVDEKYFAEVLRDLEKIEPTEEGKKLLVARAKARKNG